MLCAMERPRIGLRQLGAALVTAAVALAAATAPAAAEPALDGAGAIKVVRSDRLNDRLLEFGLRTPALADETNLRVLLPSGYRSHPDRRYPVLYLLHGCCDFDVDGSQAWTVHGMAQQLTRGLPLIVVMPAGGRGGFYSDWYNGGDFGPPMYETYHVDELIPWIDGRFRTEARRRGRVIAGLSMGGFGSMSYAARHPDLFVGAAAFSGAVDNDDPAVGSVFDLLPGLDGAEPNAVWGPSATERIRRRARNPVDLAQNLRGMRLVLRTGNGLPGGKFGGGPDPIEAGVHQVMTTLHRTFADLGLPHTWEDYGPGAHQWPYWALDLKKTLPQLMRTLAHPPPRPRRVDYRAVEPRYEVFGWHVAIDRKVLEFSRLSRASKRGFTLSGSGSARVRTPAAYRPGRFYRVRSRSADGFEIRLVRASRRGRLRIPVPLGPSNEVQQDRPGAETTVFRTRVAIKRGDSTKGEARR